MPSRSSSRTSRRSTKTTSSLPRRPRASSRLIVVMRAFASSTIWRNPLRSFMAGLPSELSLSYVTRVRTLRPCGECLSGVLPQQVAEEWGGMQGLHELARVDEARQVTARDDVHPEILGRLVRGGGDGLHPLCEKRVGQIAL